MEAFQPENACQEDAIFVPHANSTFMERAFAKIGAVPAYYPWACILASFVVTIALTAGDLQNCTMHNFWSMHEFWLVSSLHYSDVLRIRPSLLNR